MNNRIKELERQADEYADGLGLAGDEWCDAQSTKFAELIVAEVIDKIESVGFKSSNDIPFEITDLFVGQIKEHFGVDNK